MCTPRPQPCLNLARIYPATDVPLPTKQPSLPRPNYKRSGSACVNAEGVRRGFGGGSGGVPRRF
eukprot:72908-Alexandrium_andersonii.AAC.1